MTASFHARAKVLFLAARALEGQARADFLENACSTDPSLRAEVESLLSFAVSRTPNSGPGATAPWESDELAPGSTYAERFRVIELLGRGGMGEVYRVHDTVLDQPVALKRLLARAKGDQARLLHEVRLARQVTHPAVCRVFDVGQVNDELFFTMEYIDGEDLTSLLRRIGRIPPDKVIDIARQACAGLAAAHARGILHRDLKPGNLMVDRAGFVRITDFGIAAHTSARGPQGLGTPAYMAPELFDGAAASAQSDIYSLGVVLYQLLTGRHPFDGQPIGERARAARNLVAEIPEMLDRAVLAAIDPDPRLRPASALGLAAALPGVDALRVALEVGELPSPNLVAIAGSPGGLAWGRAAVLAAGGVAGLAALVLTSGSRLIDRAVVTDQPAVLAARARALLEEVTDDRGPKFSAYRLSADEKYFALVARRPMSDVDGRQLARLVYRQGRGPVVSALVLGAAEPFALTEANPPITTAGDASIVLDTSGRLLSFESLPDDMSSHGPIDWGPFFRAGGVDPGSAKALASSVTSSMEPSQRAWAATRETGESVRIEAEAATGRPRRFRIVRQADAETPAGAERGDAGLVGAAVSLTLIPIALLLARRNVRARAADTRGALRLGATLFVCALVSGGLGASFMPLAFEVQRATVMAGIQLLLAALGASFYLAFEPIVRRRWPWGLIAWSRLLAGRVRDPIVGRDILIGSVAAIATSAVYQVLVAADIGLIGDRPAALAYSALVGPRHHLSALLAMLPQALSGAMILVFLFTIFVRLLKHAWAAAAALLALFLLLGQLQAPVPLAENVITGVAFACLVALFVRLGLVALTAYLFVNLVTTRLPLSFAADWRSELAVLTLAFLLTLLIGAAFVASAPSRRTLRDPDLTI
jgi:predicted Ser/Thr protein kinase